MGIRREPILTLLVGLLTLCGAASSWIPLYLRSTKLCSWCLLFAFLSLYLRDPGDVDPFPRVSCPEGAPMCLMCLGVKGRRRYAADGRRWRQRVGKRGEETVRT